ARQLLEELKHLVQAEMNFVDEAAKEDSMIRRAKSRPWYARFLAGRTPYIPSPHPIFVGEDIMIEEFENSTRFDDLPRKAIIGPSKGKLAKLAVDEGLFAMIFEEWLEPDPHTGNRNAKKGWLNRVFTRLVMMDLGQGEPVPIDKIKPIMKAGIALEAGDARRAAESILTIVQPSATLTPERITAVIAAGLNEHPAGGTVERIIAGMIAAEKLGVLPRPEYASLEKAFMYYAGYSEWLPKSYLDRALERALTARLLRDRPRSLGSLIWLGLRRTLFGTAAVRGELESIIDGMQSQPASKPKPPVLPAQPDNTAMWMPSSDLSAAASTC
ncbi:MAG: AarF/UbiB family protein, partial [Elusimicrobia bacterium]|nr:AarF/UbiB family protein [Elusimicrobiota bacterium]